MNAFKKTDCFWIGRLVDEWPLMRSFIKRNCDKFNKFYYVINYTTDQFYNRSYYTKEYYEYPELIKDDLKSYNFEIIYLNTDYSEREWRDQCFNEFLKKSDAEYIYHLDPDMYVDQNYIDYLSRLDYFDFDILCPIWSDRIWPFLFCSRYLIDKTTRDFTTNTVRTCCSLEKYKNTKNLKESCYKRPELGLHGDHGDKLIEELLELTNFKGWKFYQTEGVECIHYAGRTNFHKCIYDVIYKKFNPDINTLISSQRETHKNYLNKIKETGINLFDNYINECSHFEKL